MVSLACLKTVKSTSESEIPVENEDMDLLDYQCVMEMSFCLLGERHFCK